MKPCPSDAVPWCEPPGACSWAPDVNMRIMADTKSTWESFKAEGTNVVDKLKDVLKEGNVRRVVIEHNGRTVAEFPLSIGVVGVVLAPVVAAVAAVVALVQDCTIKIEREHTDAGTPPSTPS